MKYRKPPPVEKMKHVDRLRKKRRPDGNVGNSGMKYCVHYRCGNKIRPSNDRRPGRKYKRSCGARKTLSMPVDWYDKPGQVPKCPSCGARQWVRDVYRDQREGDTCWCSGFPYPHRRFSYTTTRGGTDFEFLCMKLSPQQIAAIQDRIDPVPF